MPRWMHHPSTFEQRLQDVNRNSGCEPPYRCRPSQGKEMVINLVSGMCGGTANVLFGQPFDTAKTKLQIYPNYYKGMSDSMMQTWRQEKLRGLYSGLVPNLLVNVVEAAAVFVFYPMLQVQYARANGIKDEDLTPLQKAYLGSVASIASATCMTPFEVIKCRLQVARENWILHQKGLSNAALAQAHTPPTREIIGAMIKWEGKWVFVKGLRVTILRDVIGYFFYFGTYELALQTMCPPCTRGSGFPVSTIFVAGGLGGIMHYVSCFPIDVVRSRQQNSTHNLSALSVAKSILRNEGPSYFWSGIKPVLIRTFPGSGIFFLVYENMRKHLRAAFLPESDEAKEAKKDGGGVERMGAVQNDSEQEDCEVIYPEHEQRDSERGGSEKKD